MSDLTRRYEDLKEKSESLQRHIDQAKGALSVQMTQLKTNFKCADIPAAEKLLAKLEKDEKKAQAEFEEAVGNFEEAWGEVLEEL